MSAKAGFLKSFSEKSHINDRLVERRVLNCTGQARRAKLIKLSSFHNFIALWHESFETPDLHTSGIRGAYFSNYFDSLF